MKHLSEIAVAGVLALGASQATAETVLNALFMSQSAYSEADVRSMAEAYTTAHPDVKINLEFVPYEGLRDKTLLAQGSGGGYDVVLFDVIWPAEYATSGILRTCRNASRRDEVRRAARSMDDCGIQRQAIRHAGGSSIRSISTTTLKSFRKPA